MRAYLLLPFRIFLEKFFIEFGLWRVESSGSYLDLIFDLIFVVNIRLVRAFGDTGAIAITCDAISSSLGIDKT